MRYTTIIDIRDSSVYRSMNARLVYLHLSLAAGYHDSDRDLVDVSLRRLAADIGVTLSTLRAALKALEKCRLITREGAVIRVRKWVQTEDITPRPKSKAQQRQIDIAVERRRQQEQRELEAEVNRRQREQLFAQGKTNFMLYVEELKRKAEAGDEEAAKLFARHRQRYEEAVRNMTSNQQNQQ